jgi:hypothetical protein
MIASRQCSCFETVVLGVALALMAACGGGGVAGSRQPGGGDGKPNDGGTGSIGACGVAQATGLTSAGPAEGIWRGGIEVFLGTYLFANYPIAGVIAEDGEAYFQVGRSQLWVGTVSASGAGGVQTSLVGYGRLEGAGIGGPVNGKEVSRLTALVFGGATAHTSLTGRYSAAPFAGCEEFALPFDERYLHPASLESIAGVYTAIEEEGYALTVTVHSDGQLDGSDTRGCVLFGDVTIPTASRSYYRAVARVSSCGPLNGRYAGLMFLRDHAEPGDNLSLVMSLSNRDSAIFYALTR